MEFDWRGCTEKDFSNYHRMIEQGVFDYDEDDTCCTDEVFIGCVRTGNLAFDLMAGYGGRNRPVLQYDLFVGGVDSGYGYSHPGGGVADWFDDGDYPYDYVDGGIFGDPCIGMTYDDFVARAESAFRRFIEEADKTYADASLTDKANEPLHVW